MSKPKILVQLDADDQASVFDAVVAIDSGVQHLLQYAPVLPAQVRNLVHGAIFTRGIPDLMHTAIFVGGSHVAAGEELLAAVTSAFFGPMRVSVMLDANGANTTAAAAVLAAGRHVNLAGATAAVLAGTGPVGQRAARLLARAGAAVRICSRSQAKAAQVAQDISRRVPEAQLSPWSTTSEAEVASAMAGASVVIAAGAAGIELLSEPGRRAAESLRVAIDLNAVPPLGLAGVSVMDKAVEHQGVVCYGAIGVGGLKMKIHKAALQKLYESNSLVLDAEEIFALGQNLG